MDGDSRIQGPFIFINLDNYNQVETTNSKALLFIITSNTILIEHEIFNPKKGATKVIVSKLWPVYYISSI